MNRIFSVVSLYSVRLRGPGPFSFTCTRLGFFLAITADQIGCHHWFIVSGAAPLVNKDAERYIWKVRLSFLTRD
jgi:hypothetical protein